MRAAQKAFYTSKIRIYPAIISVRATGVGIAENTLIYCEGTRHYFNRFPLKGILAGKENHEQLLSSMWTETIFQQQLKSEQVLGGGNIFLKVKEEQRER